MSIATCQIDSCPFGSGEHRHLGFSLREMLLHSIDKHCLLSKGNLRSSTCLHCSKSKVGLQAFIKARCPRVALQSHFDLELLNLDCLTCDRQQSLGTHTRWARSWLPDSRQGSWWLACRRDASHYCRSLACTVSQEMTSSLAGSYGCFLHWWPISSSLPEYLWVLRASNSNQSHDRLLMLSPPVRLNKLSLQQRTQNENRIAFYFAHALASKPAQVPRCFQAGLVVAPSAVCKLPG